MPRDLSVALALMLSVLCGAARAQGVNNIVKSLPAFKLADPAQKEHAQSEVSERGAVVIVTIPNVKHAAVQDQWARWITKKGWNKDGPRLVFIEDVGQMGDGKIKETAREKLKEQYRPGKNPLILLDEKSDVRKALGVNIDETVVLLVNAKGEIVKSWEGEPTLEAAKEIVEAAAKLGK
ncbi:MAG: hypothetical protein KIS92_12230 [Planctomycetota bacterium]|nr:hypothetical protein [Planctomycetota bacterium]